MRKHSKKAALAISVIAGLSCTYEARAGVPVFDLANFASNVVQNYQLLAIKRALEPDKGGQTINYYTKNIDNSVGNINTSINHNTEISGNDFTWIISKGDGDEDVPIPSPVTEMLDKILNGHSSDEYANAFQSAKFYGRDQKDFGGAGVEGSRARKAANDALVKALEIEQKGLGVDGESFEAWMKENLKADGHGRQLQVANALAGTEVNQLMKLRSMMLVSGAARAAEAQASADKEARAIATSKAMRAELSSPRYQMLANQPKY